MSRFLKEQANGNLAIIDELLAPHFVDLSLLPGQEPDREGYKRSVAEMSAPLGDLLSEVIYSFVGESWEEDDITLLTPRHSY